MFSFLTYPISQAANDKKITNWADNSTGEFKRGQSQFRSHISSKPNAEFPAEGGRYHLYVSYACPWGKSPKNQPVPLTCLLKINTAQRTLIVRKLKGLEDTIPYTSVHWEMLEKGIGFIPFIPLFFVAKPLFSCSQGGVSQHPMRISQGRTSHLILITRTLPISVKYTSRSTLNIKGASPSQLYMIISKVKL